MITINFNQGESKEATINSLISTIDGILNEGDIAGKVFDMQNYQRYLEANEIGLLLANSPKEVEIECKSHSSFATTTFVCESFGFGVTIEGPDTKERYLEFLNMVDYLYISSGPKPTQISVSFTINDVWTE